MSPRSRLVNALRRCRRPLRRFLRSSSGQGLIFALAATLLGYSAWAEFTRYQATRRVGPDLSQVVTTSTDQPGEAKPDLSQQYKVAADKPRIIRLPSIRAEGFVQQVGIDQHQAIAVPSNIHMAGWFNQSQLPGAKGLSIIDGHLDGRTGGGIFEHLARIKTGDKFTITYGDGSTKSFVVRRVHSLPTADTAAVLYNQDPQIDRQLNLITCGGTYDKSSKQYDQRVVVVAELVQPH